MAQSIFFRVQDNHAKADATFDHTLIPPTLGAVLPSYASDAAFVAAKGSPATEGDRYWNTTIKKEREYTTAWRDIVYRVIDANETYNVPSDTATIAVALGKFEKKLLVANGKISVAAGTYSGPHTLKDILTSDSGFLTIEGDTRDIVGFGFVHGSNPTLTPANGGSGVITLSNVGNDITVARATTNPDFDAAGIVSGDTVWIAGDNGITGVYTVSSALNNVITLTGAAPTIGGNGSVIVVIPNRRLDNLVAFKSFNGKVLLRGFDLGVLYFGELNASVAELPGLVSSGTLFLRNCVSGSKVVNRGGGTIICGGADGSMVSACTFSGGNQGVETRNDGIINMAGVTFMGQANLEVNGGSKVYIENSFFGKYCGTRVAYGGILRIYNCEFREVVSALYCYYGGKIFADSTKIKNSAPPMFTGVNANYGGEIAMQSCVVENCNLAVIAQSGGRISAVSTVLSGNTQNYSPSTSGALGNNGALIAVN